ncbi:peptidase, M48 family [Treponema primitia ZAS-2]|uniref:Peptidase, M48 family n=1 Tax=Treponema primitia (strain ATCC BAA-887 / DSM 12427 / ZAS-2) TaxID=545694 RepID=F5YN77_TREPZ|nr:M48 family metallopeptidase [Treponema primitia]AEF83601.1 peptidase, M48 family [Treponema primitia ZAS-2]
MKIQIKRAPVLCMIPTFALVLFSCAGMARAIGESADEMGESRGANALSQSAHSIEKALETITPDQKYYIGRAAGANILSNYPIYTENPDLVLYLNEIATAIIINSSSPSSSLLKPELFSEPVNGYHVAILNSPEINAFSTSGGHIFVTRGLLECAASEDTLAAVIAHEIAHIQLQHGIRAIKSSRVINAITTTGSSAAGFALSELTEILNEAATDIVSAMNNGYAQEQEFAADNQALKLLADAGYEPSSLTIMLQSLKTNQPSHPGGFNQTHPSPEERIAKLNRPLQQYSVQDTRSYRNARYSAIQ